MKSICIRTYRPKYSGYGYGITEFFKSLKRSGYNARLENALGVKLKPAKEDIVIHFGFPHFFQLDEKKINIGRVMLESNSIPKLWACVMNGMDEIWVASTFNRKTFTHGGVNKNLIHVVPDMAGKAFEEVRPKPKPKNKKKFIFLSVFLDISLRKGWDIMLEEFCYTFNGDKKVEWVVQCSAPSARELRKKLRVLKEAGVSVDNIKVLGKRPSRTELLKLYGFADCFVLPTRGEGFGRPYMEASICGLPIIATGWSGQLDFLNRKNSRLLKYSLQKVPAPDALDCYFLAGDKWAEPNREDLSKALKEAIKRTPLLPVDLSRFSEKSVMEIVSQRILAVEKRERVKTELKPEIRVYGKNWNGKKVSERELKTILKKYGNIIAVAGRGNNAGWLSDYLNSNNFKVAFYLDRAKGKFKGKPVYPLGDIPINLKADIVLISSFPASFEEWVHKLKNRFKVMPIIFYRAVRD